MPLSFHFMTFWFDDTRHGHLKIFRHNFQGKMCSLCRQIYSSTSSNKCWSMYWAAFSRTFSTVDFVPCSSSNVTYFLKRNFIFFVDKFSVSARSKIFLNLKNEKTGIITNISSTLKDGHLWLAHKFTFPD